VRLHGTTLYNSLYRFDDAVLVNTHVYRASAFQIPVLHLRRLDGGSPFDLYRESFEAAWEAARPYAPANVDASAQVAG
jgi:hypothetical protein